MNFRDWGSALILLAMWYLPDRTSRRTVAGVHIRVITQYSPAAEARFLDSIVAAIELIERTDPSRLPYMRLHFRGVLVSEYPLGPIGSFSNTLRLCIVAPRYLDRGPGPASIACTLVHETMHARVRAARIKSDRYTERIERLCVAAEIGFAKRLGNARAILREARARQLSIADLYCPTSLVEAELRAIQTWTGFRWMQRSMHRKATRRLERLQRGTSNEQN